MKLLFSEAKEILDYAQELQKVNGRYLNTTVEQANLTQIIIEKAEKLVKDLGLEDEEEEEEEKKDIDFRSIYGDSDNLDEFVRKCKAEGADEDEAVNLFYEIQSKYQE